MLPKNFRLRKRTEFSYSFKHGKFVGFNNFNLVLFTRKDKLLRIGFSVSKKVGKAVVRNKVKRRMSSIIHKNLKNISRGFNLIFIAKPEIANISFIELEKELNFALDKCSLK